MSSKVPSPSGYSKPCSQVCMRWSIWLCWQTHLYSLSLPIIPHFLPALCACVFVWARTWNVCITITALITTTTRATLIRIHFYLYSTFLKPTLKSWSSRSKKNILGSFIYRMSTTESTKSNNVAFLCSCDFGLRFNDLLIGKLQIGKIFFRSYDGIIIWFIWFTNVYTLCLNNIFLLWERRWREDGVESVKVTCC